MVEIFKGSSDISTMKRLAFILLITPLFSYSQKIALLDRKMKQPILYTDSVSLEQLRSGYFPVLRKDLDSFTVAIKQFKNLVASDQRSKADSYELKTGFTKFSAQTVRMAYGDRYHIITTTDLGYLSGSMTIASGNDKNKRTIENLENLIKYIQRNVSIMEPIKEIQPRTLKQ
jgi:hypothetical protein